MRITVALCEFWLFRGLNGEGRVWFDRALVGLERRQGAPPARPSVSSIPAPSDHLATVDNPIW